MVSIVKKEIRFTYIVVVFFRSAPKDTSVLDVGGLSTPRKLTEPSQFSTPGTSSSKNLHKQNNRNDKNSGNTGPKTKPKYKIVVLL